MYCKYCGKEIDDDALFCKYCGKSLKGPAQGEEQPQPAAAQGTAAKGTYTLKIVREAQVYAVNPAVKIKIDGDREFKIENDSTLDIPIEGGEHVIYFSCGPRNKTVKKNITEDTVLSMKWNRITGAMQVD